MDRTPGPNERRLLDEFEKMQPDEEQKKRIASDLREVGNLLVMAADDIEGGDIMALGRMLSEPAVGRFLTIGVTTKAIAGSLYDAVRELDAETN